MEHRSSFDLTIGKALISQIDVMAEIGRDIDGDWCIEAIYADAIEIDGKLCRGSRDYVVIPDTHFLYKPVLLHFLNGCRHEIDERWQRHSWRYTGERASMFNDAGRTL